jgi:hypothetical protein
LELTVLHAKEIAKPKSRPAIHWKLLTDLPVENANQAVEKVAWYALRWKIEVFHKVLKSGCKVQDSKLRSAHPISNLLALKSILAWRIFWLTMLTRSIPEAAASAVFTDDELKALERLVPKSKGTLLGDPLTRLASKTPPPGNLVMWRGMERLGDIVLGMRLRDLSCG